MQQGLIDMTQVQTETMPQLGQSSRGSPFRWVDPETGVQAARPKRMSSTNGMRSFHKGTTRQKGEMSKAVAWAGRTVAVVELPSSYVTGGFLGKLC